jgi:hypothetical protein
VITSEQAAPQKDTLPRGWGRFGKAVDHLVEISTPDEELVATCVTLNPTFQHRAISTEGTLLELTKSTNTVLAVTTRRLIVVATGAGGAPRSHYVIPFEGLSITDQGKKEVTLGWAEGEARFRGAAKPQLPALVQALNERIQPAT